MTKSSLYKSVLSDIRTNNITLENIMKQNCANKNIYLELLMNPNLINFLTVDNDLEKIDYFYLVYKFTTKYKILDDYILKECKHFIYDKNLRSIIVKILKYYEIDDLQLTSKFNLEAKKLEKEMLYNKINSKEFKYVKNEISIEEWKSFPKKYTKIGYVNLRYIIRNNKQRQAIGMEKEVLPDEYKCNTQAIEIIEKQDKYDSSITELFLFNKFDKKFYEHEDEEVRIQNFLSDPRKNLENFINKNYMIKNIYNFEYLISNIKCKYVSDLYIDKLIRHTECNVRYLGYSLFDTSRNSSSLVDNLIFDTSKTIRNKFVSLLGLTRLTVSDILHKKINQKTLIDFVKEKKIRICDLLQIIENIKMHTQNNTDTNEYLNTNIEVLEIYCNKLDDQFSSKDTRIYYLYKKEHVEELMHILLHETKLKYILRLEKYLNSIFCKNDEYDYKSFIDTIFKTLPVLNVRKSGGISVICKCILKNKKNRDCNLRLICKHLGVSKFKFMGDPQSFNIFIEIFKKYKIVSDEDLFSHILTKMSISDFNVKNMCLRSFEVIYKRDSNIRLSLLDYQDDAFFLFLCMYEKLRKVSSSAEYDFVKVQFECTSKKDSNGLELVQYKENIEVSCVKSADPCRVKCMRCKSNIKIELQGSQTFLIVGKISLQCIKYAGRDLYIKKKLEEIVQACV